MFRKCVVNIVNNIRSKKKKWKKNFFKNIFKKRKKNCEKKNNAHNIVSPKMYMINVYLLKTFEIVL